MNQKITQTYVKSLMLSLSEKFKTQSAEIPDTDYNWIRTKASDLVSLLIKKNSEYGSSWRRRGGVGAFFTIWRKADRLEAQLKSRGYNIFDVTDDPTSTESLDETLVDFWCYLGLVIESRQRIREMADGARHVQSSVNPQEGDLDKISKKDPAENTILFYETVEDSTLSGAPGAGYVNQDRGTPSARGVTGYVLSGVENVVLPNHVSSTGSNYNKR